MDKHVNSLDRISALPDEVLSQMLSFLPTRDAVRTSILSKSWRYLSTMTSCLSFDDTPCFDDSDSDEDKIIEATQLFKKFVDKVLESHQATAIKKFLLVCLGDYDISDLNRWVRSGFQESVQELHLEYIKFRDFRSMEQLFSCCGMLQNLTLICCTCYRDRFGHAIYRTEKLKMLKVKECYFNDGTFEIDAPNLGYLNLKFNKGLKVVPSWKDSGSFVKAKLTFNYRYSECDIVLGFRGFDQELLNAAASKATKLVLLDAMVELFRSLNDEEEIQMPVFHCLSKLVLNRWDYRSSEYVTNLLSSPQLKYLT
ncbi:F-box/LRR-repeat protein At3g58900-like [Silene latifolia]|uniref:F-box/LRR-repeat protein At3g58900-like n=1 Tax=Silene latifolia TaxID=37657 RepID=UPI003D78720F